MDTNNLDDDVVEYKGGTLEIHTEENKNTQMQAASSIVQQDDSESVTIAQKLLDPLSTLPKKVGERIWGKPNETNASSKSLLQIFQSPPESPSDFFTFRDGVIEKAVKECIEEVLDPEIDGEFIASFLLTEVTFWDTEKERLVLITTNNCIIIKYDFIALRRLECKRIILKNIDSVVIGELVYPSASLVPRLDGFVSGVSNVVKGCVLESWSKSTDKRFDINLFQNRERNLQGIRLMWNKGEPLTFTTKWNPFNKDLPFATFISHPLSFQINKDTNDDGINIFAIEDFNEKILTTVQAAQKLADVNECIIHHNNIVLQSYLGIGSLIHNKNALGFFKVRGKFSF